MQAGITVVRDLELSIKRRYEVILHGKDLVFAHTDSDLSPLTAVDHDTITRTDGLNWSDVGYGAERLDKIVSCLECSCNAKQGIETLV